MKRKKRKRRRKKKRWRKKPEPPPRAVTPLTHRESKRKEVKFEEKLVELHLF